MNHQRKPYAALLILVIAIFACSLPSGQPTPIPTVTVSLPPSFTPISFATETLPPTPTLALTVTPSIPMVSVSKNTNCRIGPGTAYEIVGGLLIGETAEVVGKYQAGAYWVIKNPNRSGTCWLWGNYATVSGNTSGLPEMTAPPTPTFTASPIPTTAVSGTQANLVPGIVVFDPVNPICNQTLTVGLDVANLGTQPTTSSGTVSLVDTRVADTAQQASTTGGFPALLPGQTFRVNMPLTVSTWYNESHRIILTIDPGNLIPENNEGDNNRSVEYVLQKGSCP
jgi:uncharacterized protein YgiM (DUF1202 family)